MTTKRMYDHVFRERAVKLSYEGSSLTGLASESGVFPDRIMTISEAGITYGSRNVCMSYALQEGGKQC